MKPRKTSNRSQRAKRSGRSGVSGGQRRYYSRSRRRSHDAAEADRRQRPAAPEHPLICPDEPILVADGDALAELLDHLRGSGGFAYDTEFIGELTYYPKLCVIQVATADRVALIDPLAAIDLSGFWALVVDPAAETVVHAGVQDLEPAYRHTGRRPEGVFDTQIAIGFTGLPYPLSLREAVRLFLGVKLGKGMTFTQWDQRPLSSSQMHYAADDVRYLPALRAEVGARLAETGHTQWAADECESLGDPALYEFDAIAQCRRIRGTRDLTARQLAVLAALLQWRERCARDQGVPVRSLVKDEVLKAMARRPPKSVDDLTRTAALSRRLIGAEGANIIQAVEQGRGLPDNELPAVRPSIESATVRHQIDCAWALVQAYCFGRSVHPNLVSSRQELADLLAGRAVEKRISRTRLGHGWRDELIGSHLTDILTGRANLQLNWSEGELRARLATNADKEG